MNNSRSITGLKDVIETNHKPLLVLLKIKGIVKLSARIQRFCMRFMQYQYQIVYTRGKHLIADALSRAPASSPSEMDDLFEGKVNFME